MLKLFHFMHDESKLKWEFWCGAVKYRKRVYTKPNEVTIEYLNMCRQETIDRYIKEGNYHTFFGHTLESATEAAMKSKGDNYHI